MQVVCDPKRRIAFIASRERMNVKRLGGKCDKAERGDFVKGERVKR